MKKGSTHIFAPSWLLLVSHASLKVEGNSMIETGLLVSKKCAFICDLTFFTFLDMELDMVSL